MHPRILHNLRKLKEKGWGVKSIASAYNLPEKEVRQALGIEYRTTQRKYPKHYLRRIQ